MHKKNCKQREYDHNSSPEPCLLDRSSDVAVYSLCCLFTWICLRCAADRDEAENRLHLHLFNTNVSALVDTRPADSHDHATNVDIALVLRKFIELVSCVGLIALLNYTVSQKKEATKLWAVTLSNLNRF